MRLDGKVSIITGAGGGMGQVAALLARGLGDGELRFALALLRRGDHALSRDVQAPHLLA